MDDKVKYKEIKEEETKVSVMSVRSNLKHYAGEVKTETKPL